jgi:guanine deaminase
MPRLITGSILNPQPDRTVDFIPQGVIATDNTGRISFIGSQAGYIATHGPLKPTVAHTDGLILPPMLDLHTHAPQWPVRGRFTEAATDNATGGRLISGLMQTIFPAEARFDSLEYARHVVDAFIKDTRANGVIGGCTYLTVHPEAAFDAMTRLGPFWHGGLVLMDQHCPDYLRNNVYVQEDLRNLAESLGRRLVITDRFAIVTSSPLRQFAAAIAREFGLMTQTHLNEQIAEKKVVEAQLYPDADSYTQVYLRDGLLDTRAILAHCIHMTAPEWAIVQSRRCIVAHCPTSNALLGSGVMDLDALMDRSIDYAICTDVGAAPTTSLLAEMAMFLRVHRGRSSSATACEALYRTTLAPAVALGVDHQVGQFKVGMPLNYIVRTLNAPVHSTSAEDVIRDDLLALSTYRWRVTDADVNELATGEPSAEAVAAFEHDAATLGTKYTGVIGSLTEAVASSSV